MAVLGVGEAAALGAALLWSGCAQCFGAAGLRIGSVAVNHVRLVGALVLLVALHVAITGRVLPDVTGSAGWLLAVSGVVGLTLGDASGFRALVLIGPAMTTLVMTASPAMAAALAYAFLGERLAPTAFAGMALTVAGIGLAVSARLRLPRADSPPIVPGAFHAAGLLFALGGALGQAGGVVLARPALATTPALSAALVRIAAGTAALWAFTLLRAGALQRAPAWWTRVRDRRGLLLTLAGTVTGPVLAVWLAQVATKNADVAVAATLMSVAPVFVLLERWALGTGRPLAMELAGTTVAVGGVALLVTS